MHYDTQVFRPPQEARTPLLQVTSGCSYNRCTYCNMYDRNPFRLSPKEEILSDIEELAAAGVPFKRIFLLNGDPFVLSREKLTWIFDAVQQKIPSVEEFTMYASVRNVAAKSDDDLRYLRSRGVKVLYMGIESGYDPALIFVDKGYTAEEAKTQLRRLESHDIAHRQGVMLGMLGAGRGVETGSANGKFFSDLAPDQIWLLSTTVMPGTKLARLRDCGEYVEASEYERVQEIAAFLETVEMKQRTYFNSIHPTNSFNLEGFLPDDKERMLSQCRDVLERYDEESMDRMFDRKNFRSL